jgi:hypothetical protein
MLGPSIKVGRGRFRGFSDSATADDVRLFGRDVCLFRRDRDFSGETFSKMFSVKFFSGVWVFTIMCKNVSQRGSADPMETPLAASKANLPN